MGAKRENCALLMCVTPSGEEQCVLILSRQAQTHACQDAALTSISLSGLGHIQWAHIKSLPN